MKLTSILEGVGLGALLMYLYDPDRGNSRRSVIRDQARAQMRRKRQAIDVMTRDLTNRTQGWKQMARSRFSHEPVDDTIMCERVRSELGRVCTHPGSIQVMCDNGHVTLSGDILAHEVQPLVRMVRFMPGVRSVDNNLAVHETSEGIPGLQGQGHLPQRPTRWTPASCLLAGAAGALLTVYGTGRRGISGTIFQAIGMGMVVKAFSDVEHRFDPMNPMSNEMGTSTNTNARDPHLDGEHEATSTRRRSRTTADQSANVI